MAKILVAGGAGYIGSHMVDILVQNGHEVIVYDNLSAGFQDAVLDAKLIVADLTDTVSLDACFAQYGFDAVMHFAGSIQVGESVNNPAKYYQNNVVNSLNLLNTMVKHEVYSLIFSSSAAVYGEPQYTPIDINHPKNPVNPYGRSKWFIEQIAKDYDRAYNLKTVSLRYFNAAGADPRTRLGERHNPETHLIPLVLQAASGKQGNITIYGNDYPTKDGTCIRDYIHIVDLCEAHLLALDALLNQTTGSAAYNIGNGQGYSVHEIINIAESVTGKKIPIKQAPRRAGDPAVLVADAMQIQKDLHWQPQFPDLENIIRHAWLWELKQSKNNSAA